MAHDEGQHGMPDEGRRGRCAWLTTLQQQSWHGMAPMTQRMHVCPATLEAGKWVRFEFGTFLTWLAAFSVFMLVFQVPLLLCALPGKCCCCSFNA